MPSIKTTIIGGAGEILHDYKKYNAVNDSSDESDHTASHAMSRCNVNTLQYNQHYLFYATRLDWGLSQTEHYNLPALHPQDHLLLPVVDATLKMYYGLHCQKWLKF